MSGFVNHANRFRVGMIAPHKPRSVFPESFFFPIITGQELLQIARRNACLQCDWFNTLARQLAELASHINLKFPSLLDPTERIAEFPQKTAQFHSQSLNLFAGHP